MSEKDTQQWIQWALAVILIPALAVIFWQVFENKVNIAILQANVEAQTLTLTSIESKMDAMYNYLLTFEPKQTK